MDLSRRELLTASAALLASPKAAFAPAGAALAAIGPSAAQRDSATRAVCGQTRRQRVSHDTTARARAKVGMHHNPDFQLE